MDPIKQVFQSGQSEPHGVNDLTEATMLDLWERIVVKAMEGGRRTRANIALGIITGRARK
jgi:hypothetical protein